MSRVDSSGPPRPRLVVALTFSLLPARGGGQIRVLHLYRELARWFDVEVISLVGADDAELVRQIAPGMRERTVPKTKAHAAAEARLERDVGTVVTDIAMVRLHTLTPAYGQAIRRAAIGARAVVACHPYTYDAINSASDAPLWYEAQDVELDLKREILPANGDGERLLADVERVERACCREAELVWTCSAEDRELIAERYQVSRARIAVVPNGVATDEVQFVDASRRAALREDLRLDQRAQMLFIGSWHEPNIVAGRRLVAAARELPAVEFLIMGSVTGALDPRLMPANVSPMGMVSDGLKHASLAVVSGAVNPMSSGSGTNLKMLEYFAAGIPVVSTLFGARGLDAVANEHYVAALPASFADGVREMLSLPPERVAGMVSEARLLVQRRYAWSTIAESLYSSLPRIVAGCV